MAKSLGYVEVILGTASLINIKGEEKNLINNLKLHEDDVIATGDNTTLIIKLANGQTLSLGSNKMITLDESVMDEMQYSSDEVEADVEQIQEILAQSDEIEAPEETSAGESSAANSLNINLDNAAVHKINTGSSNSTSLDSFTSNKLEDSQDENEFIIAPLDTQSATIGISSIITNDTTPTITGTTNDTTAIIVLTVDGDDYTAVNHGDGTWSIEVDTPLTEGSHDVTLVATDPSGNTTEVTTTITIDTILNDANNSNGGHVVTIDAITQDTGESDSDFLTTDNTLIISGTFDNEVEHSLSITISNETYTPTITGNLWEVDLTNKVLHDGTYNVIATVTDTAGNSVNTTQIFTIDTNEDNGSTNNGNGNAADGSDVTISLNSVTDDDVINSNEAQNEEVIISGVTTAKNGEEISLIVGNISIGTATANNGIFSYTVPAGAFTTFQDGDYTLRAEVIADKAGNIAVATRDVTLDTSLDGGNGSNSGELITIDSITDDTGIVGDFITSDTTLTVSGTYDNSNGNTLTIDLGGVTYTPQTGTNIAGESTWSITLPEITTDGAYDLDITISDTAGNTQTITQTITVDTTADVDDGSGTGTKVDATITLDTVSGDNFINANEAGNILTLSGTSNIIGATVNITVGGNPFTSAVVQANGTYSVDVDTTVMKTFPDGEYAVVATVIADDAGNSVSANQTVVLDTTLGNPLTDNDNNPIVDENGNPVHITIDSITDDTGTIDTPSTLNDFITTDNQLIISGRVTEGTGNILIVKVDSNIYSTEDVDTKLKVIGDTWTLNLQDTILSEGQYSVSAILKDSAGNSETVQQNVQIVDSTDIGVINLDEISDNYINAQEATENLIITGTSSEINQTVHFKLNGFTLEINNVAITAVVTADGSFSIEIPSDTFTNYMDGEYFVEASVVKTSDGNTYTDTENVFLDTTNNGTGGGGTTANGDDATISLSTIGDGYINAQEADTGLLLIGTTTAVEGTAISFVFETTTGDKYSVTQDSNGFDITANADGTFSAFVALGDLTGIDNTTVKVTAEVVADKAGNIASSNIENVTVDLSVGTLTPTSTDIKVFESALDNGSAPSTDARTTTGNLLVDSGIADLTLESLSSNGVNATVWSENSSILTLTTESGTLFVATEATTISGIDYIEGDYLYILQNASSDTTDTFAYTLNDAAGNSASSNLNISIIDDKASINADGSIDKYISSDTSGYATNLILTLDVSGSMLWDADGSEPGASHKEWDYSGFFPKLVTIDDYDENTIRINLAKEALKNLIDKYSELGDVNVQVISFSDSATASTMLNAIDAKNYIDGLTADGATNYQAALNAAQENPANAYPDANTTQYYFISDGQPNDNITESQYTQWQTYIKDSPIDKTYAIGVGSQVDTDQLNNVSGEMSTGPDVPNEISGIDGDTIVISSITDLDDTLIQTVNTTIVTGDLTSFDADGTAINLGADGGHITQINLYDQAGNITTTLNYDSNNLSQTTATDLGGTLTINFEDGSYSYSIDYKDNIANTIETFDVTVRDSDGLSVTNSVNIHLQNSENENFAFDGSAIDAGTGYDTLVLSGAQSLDFDNITNIKNIQEIDMSKGDNEILNLDVNDVLSMTDAGNQLFISGSAGDNVTLDTALIKQNTTSTDSSGNIYDVYSDANTTVTVNIEQEIVVS